MTPAELAQRLVAGRAAHEQLVQAAAGARGGGIFDGRDHLVRPVALGALSAVLGGVAGYLLARNATGFYVGAGLGAGAGFAAAVTT